MLQDINTTDIDSLQAVSDTASVSQLDIIMQAGWIMIPILLLSLLTIYLFVERMLTLRRAETNKVEIMARIREYVNSGNIHGAQAYCEVQGKPLTRILMHGLERLGRPISEIQSAVNAAGKNEAL